MYCPECGFLAEYDPENDCWYCEKCAIFFKPNISKKESKGLYMKHYGIYIRYESYDNLKAIIQNCQEARKDNENNVKDVFLSIGNLDFELSWRKFLEVFGLRPKEIRDLLK